MAEPITFIATVSKVTTLADKGKRVVLDMGENSVIPAAWLMEAQRSDVVLMVVATAMDKQPDAH